MEQLLITLFLAGDMMLGRGVDQILPHSVDPTLHEPYVRSAVSYVELAEQEGGEIEQPVTFEYVWGDALAVLEEVNPAVRFVNLETAVTTSDEFWPGKGIHYRMHPENVQVLKAAEIDAVSLANNHVLDWGYPGLRETLQTLKEADITPVGAGQTLQQAIEPAVMMAGETRVLMFAFATPGSGVPIAWAAGEDEPGVALLPELSDQMVSAVGEAVDAHAREGDVVVFSIHWGGNWGYEIPPEQIAFAHDLIDEAGVDIVHGHSSHHVKGLEVYNDRLILYGTGDFLNDYEGIGGHEQYRPDLVLMYFPTVDARTGRLAELQLVPMQIRQMRLHRASEQDTSWLRERLERESARFAVDVEVNEAGDLVATWAETAAP